MKSEHLLMDALGSAVARLPEDHLTPVRNAALEHLREHGEGLHHVRFRVSDVDAKLAELEKEAFVPVFYKRFGPDVAFAYLETPKALGASVIELLEMP